MARKRAEKQVFELPAKWAKTRFINLPAPPDCLRSLGNSAGKLVNDPAQLPNFDTSSGNVATKLSNCVKTKGDVATTLGNCLTTSGNCATPLSNVATTLINCLTKLGNFPTPSGNVGATSTNFETCSMSYSRTMGSTSVSPAVFGVAPRIHFTHQLRPTDA